MTASDIFKDKKDNYPQSVPKLFVNTRLSEKEFFSADFYRLFQHVQRFEASLPLQMGRTSTQRPFRLWAARR